MVALLLKAKMRSTALAVKKYTLKNFPDSFEAID